MLKTPLLQLFFVFSCNQRYTYLVRYVYRWLQPTKYFLEKKCVEKSTGVHDSISVGITPAMLSKLYTFPYSFPVLKLKLSEFSQCRESDKLLRHELGSI